MAAVHEHLARIPEGFAEVGVPQDAQGNSPAPVRSRVLVHSSGFQMSPYADVKPAGESVKGPINDVGRKLWHTSPGSPG
jgi:error-prone DNA polymerase